MAPGNPITSKATPSDEQSKLVTVVDWDQKSNFGALHVFGNLFPTNEFLMSMTEEASNRGQHHVHFEYHPDLKYVIKQAFRCFLFSKYNTETRDTIRHNLREKVRYLRSQGFKVKYREFGTVTPFLMWRW